MDDWATHWGEELWVGGLVLLLTHCDSEQVTSSPWHRFSAIKQMDTALSLRAPIQTDPLGGLLGLYYTGIKQSVSSASD